MFETDIFLYYILQVYKNQRLEFSLFYFDFRILLLSTKQTVPYHYPELFFFF